MTCSPVRLQRYDLARNLILRPPGVISNAQMVLTRWLCSILVRILRVCPRGAQVRLIGQTNDCPFSSIHIRVARKSRHFFYPRPHIPLPMGNRLSVMLKGDALWLLATLAHAPQQMPDTTGRVAYTEQLPDHISDASQCPVILRIAVSTRTFQECSLQPLSLLRR